MTPTPHLSNSANWRISYPEGNISDNSRTSREQPRHVSVIDRIWVLREVAKPAHANQYLVLHWVTAQTKKGQLFIWLQRFSHWFNTVPLQLRFLCSNRASQWEVIVETTIMLVGCFKVSFQLLPSHLPVITLTLALRPENYESVRKNAVRSLGMIWWRSGKCHHELPPKPRRLFWAAQNMLKTKAAGRLSN